MPLAICGSFKEFLLFCILVIYLPIHIGKFPFLKNILISPLPMALQFWTNLLNIMKENQCKQKY